MIYILHVSVGTGKTEHITVECIVSWTQLWATDNASEIRSVFTISRHTDYKHFSKHIS